MGLLIFSIILAIILRIYGPTIKGYFGEKSVSFFLSRLDPGKYKVINNIMLKIDGRTSQIDHVVVSNYGIFVIETKNYNGWILGNEYDDYWTQVIYKRKEKLFNPIKQNYGHIQALKNVLSEYQELNYISIITFTTKADLKVKTKTNVVYTANLLKTIRKYDKETVSDSVKEKVYKKLLSLNIDDKEERTEHVRSIYKNINEKNRKITENICPRCGGTLVRKNGKYGSFTGCSNYPKCKFTVK
ncbi:MAG: NERD domain-containing protein [Clostridia bacterium]|jgi:putative lipoic acid-binding regulatory protein